MKFEQIINEIKVGREFRKVGTEEWRTLYTGEAWTLKYLFETEWELKPIGFNEFEKSVINNFYANHPYHPKTVEEKIKALKTFTGVQSIFGEDLPNELAAQEYYYLFQIGQV